MQELRHAELHLDGAKAILDAVTSSRTLRVLRMPHSMYRLTVSVRASRPRASIACQHSCFGELPSETGYTSSRCPLRSALGA